MGIFITFMIMYFHLLLKVRNGLLHSLSRLLSDLSSTCAECCLGEQRAAKQLSRDSTMPAFKVLSCLC